MEKQKSEYRVSKQTRSTKSHNIYKKNQTNQNI